ncbi:MAG: hypothetical protein ABSF26_30710 [Thermoguttaceae bacterium]|jgi:hypothetical protein
MAANVVFRLIRESVQERARVVQETCEKQNDNLPFRQPSLSVHKLQRAFRIEVVFF